MYNLSLNYPEVPTQQIVVASALAKLASQAPQLSTASPSAADDPKMRDAIALLLGATPNHSLSLTCGGQAALSVALASALSATGPNRQRVALEEHTFPTARSFLKLEQVPTVGLPMDAEGLKPDALQTALESDTPPGVLYVMPVLHNPLGLTYSATRLRTIADIARRHSLWIVEDEAYSFLVAREDRPPTLASLLPERTLVMWSLSKILSLSLRSGALSHPDALSNAVSEQIRIRGLIANPVVVAAACTLGQNGKWAALIAEKRAEGVRRRAMVQKILGKAAFTDDGAASWHIWMQRPGGESEAAFLIRTREAGLLVSAASPFHHADDEAPYFRLSLGGEADSERLEAALQRLASVLSTSIL